MHFWNVCSATRPSKGTHSCTSANYTLQKYLGLYVRILLREFMNLCVYVVCMHVRMYVFKLFVYCGFVYGGSEMVQLTFSCQLPAQTHKLKAAPKSLDSTTK